MLKKAATTHQPGAPAATDSGYGQRLHRDLPFIPVRQLKVQVRRRLPAPFCHVGVMLSTATVRLWEDQMSGGRLTGG